MANTESKAVRVRLEWVNSTKEERFEDQLQLDLVIDLLSSRAVGNLPAYGIYGPPRGAFWPFQLQVDGSVNYGYGADETPQGDTLNIRQRAVRIGELVTFKTEGDEHAYRIVSVLDIVAGKPL